MHNDPILFSLLIATAVCCLGAFTDIRSRRIPNMLTAPALLAGLLLHAWMGGLHGLAMAAAAALAGGGIFFLFFLMGGMGAGDVKLVAAACAIAGWPQVPYILVLTGLTGGIMALGLAAMRGRMRESFRNAVSLTGYHLGHGLTPHPEMNVRNASMLRLPYGIAIAAGTILTLWIHTVSA